MKNFPGDALWNMGNIYLKNAFNLNEKFGGFQKKKKTICLHHGNGGLNENILSIMYTIVC
jgi:hypothetical protein